MFTWVTFVENQTHADEGVKAANRNSGVARMSNNSAAARKAATWHSRSATPRQSGSATPERQRPRQRHAKQSSSATPPTPQSSGAAPATDG